MPDAKYHDYLDEEGSDRLANQCEEMLFDIINHNRGRALEYRLDTSFYFFCSPQI
jgi:hypothetical protein